MGLPGFRIAELSAVVLRISWFLFAVATIVNAVAAPAPQNTPSPSPTGNPNACGQIGPAVAEYLAQNPRAAAATVSAQLAFDCLQTVPNKPDPAVAMVKSLKAFVQWQSTLAFLKDPPPSYMLPATDIEGGLDNISSTAAAGGFKSEYDFQLGIVKLIISAHDGHFSYRPDVFKAFSFRNNLPLDIVSVSKDGKAVPKLYHSGAVNGTNGTVDTAPAITKINGQDAAKFITDMNLQFSSFQDPDSQWNSQFPTYASPGGALAIAASLAFQGPSVTLTYDNGQEKTEESFAILRAGVNFTGISNGEDYYNRFCNPNTQAATNTTTPAAPTNTTVPKLQPPLPTISGYPLPIVRDSGANTTSGYFLNGTGYENVAVLAVSGFSPPPEGNVEALEYITNFQSTVESFLAQSKAAGKTRLVIDLQANGGGFVVAGYELFAQLYPTVRRFQANNLRLADSLVNMARVVGGLSSNFTASTPAQRAALNALSQSSVVSNIVPGGVFTPAGANFTSVEQIVAPVSLKGDFFTAYQQTPLNDTDPQFNLTGTGTRSNPPASVFAPENVVLLTDGTCGSTCTLFSYLMILQMNVKTTVIGGRPQTGMMQSIAGVEGAQVFPLDELSIAAAAVIELAPAERKAELRAGETGLLADAYALKRLAAVANPGAVNGKNAFSATDSQTPLQFLMQPANCRIFYTAQMLSSPELVWKRTVDATWTDPNEFCVEGSIMTANTTTSGDVDPLFRLAVNKSHGALGKSSAVGEGGRINLGLLGLLAGLTAGIVLNENAYKLDLSLTKFLPCY
ncbi:peptidase S41 family protein [Rhexocercosporidium sp. MPI-PUGE-AT-0058]|nr:peptidase S41 family protein [Rhexocercosporidium sp. MPI-PUGE-AT-0058]